MATNFKLWLDTAAPTLALFDIAQSPSGNTTNLTAQLTVNDLTKDVGQLYMKVWADTVADATSTSSTIPTSWSAYSNTVSVSGITQESNVSKTYYVHAMLMDSVGNISEVINKFEDVYVVYHYCTKAPTITIDSSTPTKVVGSTSATIKFKVTPYDKYGILNESRYSYKIENTTSGKSYSQSIKSVTQGTTTTESYTIPNNSTFFSVGNNTIKITVTDSAGNVATKTCTILYDTQETTGTLYFGTSGTDGTIKSVYNGSDGSDLYLWLLSSSTDIVSVTYTVTNTTTNLQLAHNVTISGLTNSGGDKYFLDSIILEKDVSDGSYTISGTYKDTAGVTGNLTSSTTFVDTTPPSLSTSGDGAWWVNGHVYHPDTLKEITLNCTDPSPSYGMSELKLNQNVFVKTIGGTDVSSDYYMSDPVLGCNANFTEATANETRYVYVYDNAGNYSSVQLMSPIWDDTPPTIACTLTSSHVTVNNKEHLASTTTPVKSLTVTDSGSGVGYVQITWSQSGSEPTSWTTITGTSGDYTTAVNSKWSSTNADGTWYLWVKAVDNVSNSIIQNKLTFVYDKTAPTGSISWNKTYTVTQQNTVTISATDTPVNAGIKMKVTSSAISDGDTDWVNYTTSRTVTFKDTELSGTKTISVQFKDAVGNVSTTYSSTIEYASNVSPVVTIMDSTGTTAQGTHTKVLPFSVRIGMSNDNITVCKRFQLYGDFSTTSESTASTASGAWTTFKADSGKNYMTVSGLYFSKNDGVKTVSLVMENTDNLTYPVVTDTITLDRTPPQITVTNLSHNIISLQNVDREGDTHSPKCKANTVTFDFTPNEKLAAYKVCVINPTNYADTAATSAAAVAIGTSNGSVNMTGGTVAKDTKVTCTIKGADLRAHSIVNNKDGAYIVGVFGQDVAGVWSLMGTIAT